MIEKRRQHDFTNILRRFYDISPRKITDQGDFVLQTSVRTVVVQLTLLYKGMRHVKQGYNMPSTIV